MMGSAIDREVASRATARVMIAMLPKAKRKPLLGLNAGWKLSSGAMVGVSFDSGRGNKLGEAGCIADGLPPTDCIEIVVADAIAADVERRMAEPTEEGQGSW
jgi:hypothetical protein